MAQHVTFPLLTKHRFRFIPLAAAVDAAFEWREACNDRLAALLEERDQHAKALGLAPDRFDGVEAAAWPGLIETACAGRDELALTRDTLIGLCAQIAAGHQAVELAAEGLRAARAALDAAGGEEAAPTYLVRGPDYMERITLRGEVAAIPGGYPKDAELYDALLAYLDGRDGVEETRATLERAVEFARAAEAGAADPMPAELVAGVAAIEASIGQQVPAYLRLRVRRTKALRFQAYIYARRLLTGWANVKPAFQRVPLDDDPDALVVADDALLALPEGHVDLIGEFILSKLLAPTGNAAKNSASRSPSPSGRANSAEG